MNLSQNIKDSLERTFLAQFDVSLKLNNGEPTYIICPHGSDDQYFYITAEIKNKTRLILICEPEKYGAGFVQTLGTANIEKRKIFCDYWKAFEKENYKVAVKINDNIATIENFDQIIQETKKFHIRITKSPYYEDGDKNADFIVVDNIVSVCAMMLSLFNYEIEGLGFEEGKKYKLEQTKYERNPINRKLCLMTNGYKCKICGFDFEKVYGHIGKEYIEVHHKKPVSTIGEGYIVDPINDLVPICSNCHSMVHRKNPPYTIDEIKKIIEENM